MTTWRALVHTQRDCSLADAVMDRGGLLDEVDFIHRQPLPLSAIVSALGRTPEPQWVVVTSPYTVEALRELDLLEVLSRGAHLAAVGPATAQVLAREGLHVDLVPPGESSGAALAEVFPEGVGTVLIPGARDSAGTLEPGLEAKGWLVTSCPVYETRQASHLDEMIVTRWEEGEYEVFIATSPSIVRAAAHLLGPSVPVVAIGPSSAAEAQKKGFPHVLQSGSPKPEDLAAACTALVQVG
jgi:uroporphyrinogen-III synthase